MKKILITTFFIFTISILSAENPPPLENKDKFNNSLYFLPQTSDLSKNFIYPEWGFYIDAAPGYSFIENNPLPDYIWKYNGNIGYTFSIGYFKTILPFFKIKTGIGASNYREILDAYGEIPLVKLNDIDNDVYTENLTLNNVKNSVSNTYVTVPLLLEFGNTSINKMGFYINLGGSYSYLISENYKPSGTYSTSGTYDQWGVTIENVDELGFYTSKELESQAHFKKNNIALVAGAGITIPLSSMVIFKVGVVGNYGLNDISNKQPVKNDYTPITESIYNHRVKYIDNSLALTEGSRNRHLGLEFGLYFCRRVK